MTSSYSEFKPQSATPSRSSQPGHRLLRDPKEIRQDMRRQQIQQWVVIGIIALFIGVGAYLLISAEIESEDAPVAVQPAITTQPPAATRSDATPGGAPAGQAAAKAKFDPGDGSPVGSDRPVEAKQPADSMAPRPVDPPSGTVAREPAPESSADSSSSGSVASASSAPAQQSSPGPADSAVAERSSESASTAQQAEQAVISRQPAVAAQDQPVSPSASSGPQDPAPAVEVTAAQFSYQSRGGQPGAEVDYIDASRTDNGVIYFHSVVEGAPGERVTHEWRRNGSIVDTQSFNLSAQREVMVSSYMLGAQAYGTYRVYVRDASGNAISIGSALYEP